MLAHGKGENIRSDWPARYLVTSEHVHPDWKREAIRWTSREMWLNFYIPLFGDAIRREHPTLERRVGRAMEDWRVGMRGNGEDYDIGLDFQIGINTPLTKESSVKPPHVDSLDELIGGLLYMRDDADASIGGELEIYEAASPKFFGKRMVSPESRITKTGVVPYANDTGVLFLNGSRAVHGVSPRSPSPLPRLLISICADMRFNFFEIDNER